MVKNQSKTVALLMVFSKCIQKITQRAIMSLSGLSNSKFRECHTHTLLSNIKNDRDVYTHASHTKNPVLSIDEISIPLLNGIKLSTG